MQVARCASGAIAILLLVMAGVFAIAASDPFIPQSLRFERGIYSLSLALLFAPLFAFAITKD